MKVRKRFSLVEVLAAAAILGIVGATIAAFGTGLTTSSERDRPGTTPASTPGPTLTPAPAPSPTSAPSPAPTPAPVPVAGWIHQFGSPAWDKANGLAVDGEGDVIIVGATQGAMPGQTLGGFWDGFARKLSPAGAEMWTLQYTNSVSVGALSVAVDAAGDIILAGHVQGELPGQTGAGNDDAYVRKLSPAGTEVWTHQTGSADADWAFAAAVDGSGDIVAAGAANAALAGQTGTGGEDAFVQKLSPEGTELWTSQFGSDASDRVWSAAVDGSGNIIVVGRTQHALPGQTSAGSWDAFVRKYSPEGTQLWSLQFGSPAPDVANKVVVDGAGNIIVAGSTMGALPGQTRAGYDDAFVRKLSPEGKELWTLQFGTAASADASGLAVDRAGNIIVAGRVYGALPGQTQVGQQDVYVRKLSPAGIELWTLQFGSPASDEVVGVAVDSTGNIFVAGNTQGALPGQSNAGDWDSFIVRVNQPSAS